MGLFSHQNDRERHPLEWLHGALAWCNRAQEREIIKHGPNLTLEYASLGVATLTLQNAICAWLWETLDLGSGTKVLLTAKPAGRRV